MINQYVQPAPEIKYTTAQKKMIEEVLNFQKDIYQHIKGFSQVIKSLEKKPSQFITPQEISDYKNIFIEDISIHIEKFDKKREHLAFHLNNNLPESLSTTLTISDKHQLVTQKDKIGILSNLAKISSTDLITYIQENNLVVFPVEFLKDSQQCPIIEDIQKEVSTYVVGTLNNLDLYKILKKTDFSLNDFLYSKEMEPIIQSFFFQLPLLQALSQEIESLKKNDDQLRKRINVIQNSMEQFIDKQIDINEKMVSKFDQIIKNINFLNQESYEVREVKRKANPTMWVTDYEKLKTHIEDVEVEDNSIFGYHTETKIWYYHPQKEILKAPSTLYHVEHVSHDILKNKSVPALENLQFEDVKKIITHDLKNNYIVLSGKDLHHDLNVICSVGAGFHPISTMIVESVENTQDKKSTKKLLKGVKIK